MDTRLALGIKPIDIPDQAQSLQRAMTLQALQGQSTLQGLQIDEGRRTLRQNQAMDEAASGSTSTADYLTRLSKVNPGAAAKLEHELLGTQKTRGEVEEQQSKLAQGLTAGFMSVPDAQKPQAYAQFAAEWKRQGLPNADKVPDQFDPAMIPHLTMIANRGLTSEQAATRADYKAAAPQVQSSPALNALTGPQAEPIPMPLAPPATDPTSGATVKALAQPSVPSPDIANDQIAGSNKAYIDASNAYQAAVYADPSDPKIGPMKQNVDALYDVYQEAKRGGSGGGAGGPTSTLAALTQPTPVAPPPIAEAPAKPRSAAPQQDAEVMRLRALGTKVGNEAADKREERLWKERDQSKPGNLPAGVTWNVNDQQFEVDGQPVSAKKVQEMDILARKASATNINAAGGDIQLGKAASTKVDEGLLDTTARISRLDQIQQTFKPEYQQIGTRLGNAWAGLKNSLGVGISETDKSKLTEFSAYKRKAIENINTYIHDMTGSAMGVQEAQRLMQAVPNPGQSWYDGDSPIEFKAKLDDTIKSLKMAEARAVYIKRNGISTNAEDFDKQVPLERMPQIINQRGTELEGITKKRYPQMSDADLNKTVRRQLAQEFGLTAD